MYQTHSSDQSTRPPPRARYCRVATQLHGGSVTLYVGLSSLQAIVNHLMNQGGHKDHFFIVKSRSSPSLKSEKGDSSLKRPRGSVDGHSQPPVKKTKIYSSPSSPDQLPSSVEFISSSGAKGKANNSVRRTGFRVPAPSNSELLLALGVGGETEVDLGSLTFAERQALLQPANVDSGESDIAELRQRYDHELR